MARGNVVLKIAGILLIIFGIASILFAMMYGLLGAKGFSEMGKSIVTGILILYGLYGILNGFFQIAVGAVGIRHSNIPEHGTRCIVWGVVTLILGAACTFLLYVSAGMIHKASEFYPPWFGFAIVIFSGIVLPLMMIIGGILNKSMKRTAVKTLEAEGETAAVEPSKETETEVKAEEAPEESEEMTEEAAETETNEEAAGADAEPAEETAGTIPEQLPEKAAAFVPGKAAKPTGRLEYLKQARLSRNVDPRAARKFGKR